MIFQGSPRNPKNCPDQWGKTMLLAKYLIANAPEDVEIDFCDLSVKTDTSIIQPCKACYSTGGGFHCHFECDCYVPNNKAYPDFMHDAKIYKRLKKCDGFLVLTPIHWYSVTSQVKAMFDRLVCCNLTITTAESEMLGIGKDADKSRDAEKSGEFNHLRKNHYEGKYAAFFIHGDNGGTDYREFVEEGLAPKERKLPLAKYPKMPPAYKKHLKHGTDEGRINEAMQAVMPLVWQCRYSGINCPDDLIVGTHATSALSYSDSMDSAINNLEEFYKTGLELLLRLASYINN